MGIIKQKSNGKGSLKDIQVLINENQDLINCLIKNKIPELKNLNIKWLSPLKNDYSEYKDKAFIDIIKVQLKKKLSEFWPNNGVQWDGLVKTDCGKILLIEAKANIPEIVTSGSKAEKKSKELIIKSLSETKKFLNVNNDVDWTKKFYQYTNRIAHLYFLRELNNIPAFLINIYFINDKEVNGPESKKEWIAALKVLKTYLGLGRHKLSKYMIELFIDVEDLKYDE